MKEQAPHSSGDAPANWLASQQRREGCLLAAEEIRRRGRQRSQDRQESTARKSVTEVSHAVRGKQ